jgi:hypothetical protein
MFYPDHYNGAFVACPDPVDFRAFQLIDTGGLVESPVELRCRDWATQPPSCCVVKS